VWEVKFHDVSYLFGRGSISILKELGLKDPVIVTTRSLMKTELLDMVTKYSGALRVVLGPSQHTPEEELAKLKEELKDNSEITIISLGGGSIIDAVKILSPRIHIAIPTTLSGAEHTDSAGFTKGSIKVAEKVRPPNVVILDPLALNYTPKKLLVTSAFRALDHAIEAYYSTKANLFSDSLARESYRYLTECLEGGGEGENLIKCQAGTWLSSLAFMYAGRGISHVFGYIFGPRFNIPHGVTSCISLPKAIEFNYQVAKEKIDSLDKNLRDKIMELMRKNNISERLSNYAKLEDVVNYAELLKEFTNSSENPRKISYDEALEFIKSCY